MREAILPRPSSSGVSDNEINNGQSSDGEEYQVDTVSTSSCQDDQDIGDEHDELDGAMVVADQQKLPSFGSVSVVNSNDVHFGNKTVYKGPVTIKQFVYPNGDIISGDCVGALNGCVNKIDIESSAGVDNIGFLNSCIGLDNTGLGGKTAGGVDNPAFVKQKDDSAKIDITEQSDSRNTATRIRKGYQWLQNLPRKRPCEAVLFLSMVVASITILLAVVLWRNPIISANSTETSHSDINEEDNNTPIDYSTDSNATINKKVRIVSRLQWLAQPAIEPPNDLKVPVSMVIIQHTATESCYSQAQCIFQTRHIQSFHIESNGWFDIGYNFLVGGDGDAYEGRGWKHEGAHTFGYNNKSIGVGFIGTFISKPPPQNQINAFHNLLAKGVELGFLKKDYRILAARQLYATESPGKSFFEVMKKWSHWSEKP